MLSGVREGLTKKNSAGFRKFFSSKTSFKNSVNEAAKDVLFLQSLI